MSTFVPFNTGHETLKELVRRAFAVLLEPAALSPDFRKANQVYKICTSYARHAPSPQLQQIDQPAKPLEGYVLKDDIGRHSLHDPSLPIVFRAESTPEVDIRSLAGRARSGHIPHGFL